MSEIGCSIECCEKCTFISRRRNFFCFLGYISEHHRRDGFTQYHACCTDERIFAFCCVWSSIGLFIGDKDIEIHMCIDRNPFPWIECQIITVPFEIFRSIKILFTVKVYNNTCSIYAFADIFDVEDEILIERYSLVSIFRKNKVKTWWYNIGFAFWYFSKIEIKSTL